MPPWAKEMMTQLAQQNSAVVSYLQEVLNGCEELAHNQRSIPSPHQESSLQYTEVAGDQHSIPQCSHHTGSLDMQSFRSAGDLLHKQLLTADATLLGLINRVLSADLTSSVDTVSQRDVVPHCNRRFEATNQTIDLAGEGLRSNAAFLDDAMCMPVSPPISPPARLMTSSAKSQTPMLTSHRL